MPIKVVGIKFGQPDPKFHQTTTWLDGLEVKIENTSDLSIQYLVVHVEIAVGPSATDFVRVPISFGRAFAADSKSGRLELFQPRTQLTLRASKDTCKRIREQIIASKLVPKLNDVQTKLHLAIFENRTSWLAGRLHYPDPTDSKRWIAAEELARDQSQVNGLFGISFSKASYKAASELQTCYRYTGFNVQYCCTDFNEASPVDFDVGSAHFAVDPNGHVHPNTVETCCTQTPTDCCNYEEIAGGCE
ncbi:MAG TPA: hypothetical protein VFI24_04520 [Pyrinomonadaceae bacterium]|nr:hypothetical protein [Pyrinomonadaceae bacterium]